MTTVFVDTRDTSGCPSWVRNAWLTCSVFSADWHYWISVEFKWIENSRLLWSTKFCLYVPYASEVKPRRGVPIYSQNTINITAWFLQPDILWWVPRHDQLATSTEPEALLIANEMVSFYTNAISEILNVLKENTLQYRASIQNQTPRQRKPMEKNDHHDGLSNLDTNLQ